MSKGKLLVANTLRQAREERGWSQQELAARAHLSRTGVSAIEAGRLVPSTAAALALAAAFDCRVEDLFRLAATDTAVWAWQPRQQPCRYWRAAVGSRQLRYPVEPGPLGTVPHDGVWSQDRFQEQPHGEPVRTLVVACCDPAAGLLAAEYARQTPFRMLVLTRGSRASLELLSAGLVHAAGLHLGTRDAPQGNREVARQALDQDYELLRVADWEEGLAVAPRSFTGVDSILKGAVSWIGREPGSGARQLLDEISEGRIVPPHLARDHRDVAQTIRSGLAQAGVSVRLACEEAGIDFVPVRREAYDLCVRRSMGDDPRIQALITVTRSSGYRKMLAELPGYDCRLTGEIG